MQARWIILALAAWALPALELPRPDGWTAWAARPEIAPRTFGLMICWDVQYADPARALALRGAELALVPIWGGNPALVKARAIENRLFLATSGYDYLTQILDPDGELLAAAPARGAAAVATLDLNRRYADRWLGDMRGRFPKELRLDVPVAPVLSH